MPHAIQVHTPGGPEAMKWEEVTVGEPGPGEVRLRQRACGLNYIDVYFRTGAYPAPSAPFTPGMEGVGIVEALGDGVTNVAVGDRVAYGRNIGGYAEVRLIDASFVIKLPDGISDETGAAMMLQGMTTEYLLERTFAVQKGQTILFHAAAGGVGLMACQWASALGATVIGTVGSEDKAVLAKANGCAHTILYRQEDFVARVKELTDGKGVPVVYDGVGKDTFMKSLDCLSMRGVMVIFGNASGKVEPLDTAILGGKGSLYVTRPTLFSYTATAQDFQTSASRVVEMILSGKLKITVNQTYALKDAAEAHRALEARETTGSTVLLAA
ncbi:MAG: NADPH2:quinone reductase [Gammaproteobacteria bacterium]|jgi:NADPH2:quinone reductase